MNTIKAKFLAALVSLFFTNSVFAVIIYSDDFKEENHESLMIHKELFLATTELQIGGTHTYGNKTIIKTENNKGKLDPKILIVNPDPKAHSNEPSIVSIMGSGFDIEFLQNLSTFCKKFEHTFKKIYINNVLPILPLPDQYNNVRDYQKGFLNHGVMAPSERDMEENLYKYIQYLKNEQNSNHNLYSCYLNLLTDDGMFIVKSAGLSRLGMLLSKSYFDIKNANLDYNNIVLSLRSSNEDKDDYIFTHNLAHSTFLGIKEKLDSINKFFYIDYNLAIKNYTDTPSPTNILYNIQMQTHLLEITGFNIEQVSIARLKNWGFGTGTSAYSVIIKAIINKSAHPSA